MKGSIEEWEWNGTWLDALKGLARCVRYWLGCDGGSDGVVWMEVGSKSGMSMNFDSTDRSHSLILALCSTPLLIGGFCSRAMLPILHSALPFVKSCHFMLSGYQE